MKTKKNKGLRNKPGLVNQKDKLLVVYQDREEHIAHFFKDYEHYQDSIKLLLSVQQCAYTSPHYESLSDFEREEIQLRFPKVIELVMELGKCI